MFNKIQLTNEEDALEQQVHWDEPDLNLEAMGQLAESLLRRKAIPAVRLDYFTKPEMNIGGHGKKSRADVFEEHGTTGKAIFRHGNFAKYLRYFIYGPDLPDDTIQAFRKIIDDDEGTEGELLNKITALVRKEVRQKRLNDRHEEFFKLAHELGKPEWAEHVRKAAMNVR